MLLEHHKEAVWDLWVWCLSEQDVDTWLPLLHGETYDSKCPVIMPCMIKKYLPSLPFQSAFHIGYMMEDIWYTQQNKRMSFYINQTKNRNVIAAPVFLAHYKRIKLWRPSVLSVSLAVPLFLYNIIRKQFKYRDENEIKGGGQKGFWGFFLFF